MTTEARVKRLKLWLSEFDDSPATFARHYGLPHSMASYLSQLLNGHRPFGERAARNLEDSTGRPRGWLDADIRPEAQRSPLRFDVGLVARLPASERHLIEQFIGWRVREHAANTTSPGRTTLYRRTVSSRPPAVGRVTKVMHKDEIRTRKQRRAA